MPGEYTGVEINCQSSVDNFLEYMVLFLEDEYWGCYIEFTIHAHLLRDSGVEDKFIFASAQQSMIVNEKNRNTIKYIMYEIVKELFDVPNPGTKLHLIYHVAFDAE